MTLAEVIDALGLEAVCLPDGTRTITAVYTSDLLSDVMAHATAESLLVTIQNHRNSVAVATLVNARAILICHRREIPPEMLEAAQAEGIALLRTGMDQFTASCRLGALPGLGDGE